MGPVVGVFPFFQGEQVLQRELQADPIRSEVCEVFVIKQKMRLFLLP